ncbi:hypothetical protein D3C72_2279440 [compost metagenome]
MRVGFAQLALQEVGQRGFADVVLAHGLGPVLHQGDEDHGDKDVKNPHPAQAPGACKNPGEGKHPDPDGQQHGLVAQTQQQVFESVHRPSFLLLCLAISRLSYD